MATARTGKKAVSDDYARAARDWADELTTATGGEVHVAVTRSSRKGVWRVRARLVDVCDGRIVAVRVQRDCEWPNSEGTSLGAVLLNEIIKLDRTTAQDALNTPAAD